MTADEMKSGNGTKKRFLFSWKEFCIYGVIWILIQGTAAGIWKTGAFILREGARIRQMIEWCQYLDRGEIPPRRKEDKGRRKPFFRFDRKGRNLKLESWIELNLPDGEEGVCIAAGNAFRETARMLRSGELLGIRDSFAELTARIQPEMEYETWAPFLEELSERMIGELPETPEPDGIASLFDKVALAISGGDETGEPNPRIPPKPKAAETAAKENETQTGKRVICTPSGCCRY